jgi:hypothetical protein
MTKMGFDWHIGLALFIDHTTGMPYVFHLKNGERLPFNAEEWRLPEQFRRFAQMRGHHLMHYVQRFSDTNIFEASPYALLHRFPEWSAIKDSDRWAEYEWDETQHNLLKECLEWCDQKGGFNVSWSY